MSGTLRMLDSSGAPPRPAHAELAKVIDALRECEQASNACAMAMVDVGGMVGEVRRALDCADLCESAERVLSRGPATDVAIEGALVHACILACQAAADACAPHGEEHEHCRLHAEAASRAADALRSLSTSLSEQAASA